MRNYLSEMLNALTSAYTLKDRDNLRQGSPVETNIGKLFEIFAWGLDRVQEQSELIKLWDNIDNARGLVLDRYGANFGVNRLGADDRYYRLMIKVKLLSQLSGGDLNTMLNAAAALFEIPVEKITLNELFPAKIGIDINEADLMKETIENASDIAVLLKRILAAGIAMITTLYSYRESRGSVRISTALFDLCETKFDLPDVRRTVKHTEFVNAALFDKSEIEFDLPDVRHNSKQTLTVKAAVFERSAILVAPCEVKRKICGPAYATTVALFEYAYIAVGRVD